MMFKSAKIILMDAIVLPLNAQTLLSIAQLW